MRARRCENVFFHANLRKIFEQCTFVLGTARSTFNCFELIFFRSLKVVYLMIVEFGGVKPSFSFWIYNRMEFFARLWFSTVCNYRLLVSKCGFWTRSNIYRKMQVESWNVTLCFLMRFCIRYVFLERNFVFGFARTFTYFWSFVFELKPNASQQFSWIWENIN